MLLVLRVNEGVGLVTVITIQKSVNKGNVGGARRSPEAYRAQPASPISTNWMVRPKSVVAWSAERPCWRLIVLCFSRPRTIGAPPTKNRRILPSRFEMVLFSRLSNVFH